MHVGVVIVNALRLPHLNLTKHTSRSLSTSTMLAWSNLLKKNKKKIQQPTHRTRQINHQKKWNLQQPPVNCYLFSKSNFYRSISFEIHFISKREKKKKIENKCIEFKCESTSVDSYSFPNMLYLTHTHTPALRHIGAGAGLLPCRCFFFFGLCECSWI